MFRSSARRRALSIVSFIALAMLVLAASGCSSGGGSGSGYGMKQPGASGTGMAAKPAASGKMAMSSSSTTTADPNVQVCGQCNGKGKGKSVAGAAVIKDGVQVVSIAIQGGYYVPNRITVQAGMPVRVVFTGKAKGCIAKPMFKSLGKKADLTGTGVATLELGTLTAGSYGFTCAMGMGDGAIIAQ
jgi:plastocyanin